MASGSLTPSELATSERLAIAAQIEDRGCCAPRVQFEARTSHARGRTAGADVAARARMVDEHDGAGSRRANAVQTLREHRRADLERLHHVSKTKVEARESRGLAGSQGWANSCAKTRT